MEICYHQPHLIPPLRPEPRHHRSGSGSTVFSSKWVAGSRHLASRISDQSSVLLGRSSTSRTRRPTIGAPSDFRRIDHGGDCRTDGFRPLELSIYLPRNRLSPLPDFDSPLLGPGELESQAQRRRLPRSSSVLSSPSSEFRIARKPVGSSVDLTWHGNTFSSVETRSTPSMFGVDWVSQPLRPRPSLPGLLDSRDSASLDTAQLPRAPPALAIRSSTDSQRPLVRRGSDPFRPLLTSFEEDRGYLAVETIMEERSPTRSENDRPSVRNQGQSSTYAHKHCCFSHGKTCSFLYQIPMTQPATLGPPFRADHTP